MITSRHIYIDVLRVAALSRVILYHILGFWWIPFIFPSMGIMFALGGALVAKSLAKQNLKTFYYKRGRRLLLPFWLFGVVMVTAMFLKDGWVSNEDNGSTVFSFLGLLTWIVPYNDPIASDWGYTLTAPLWYLRAYLWFLVLSPMLLWLIRKNYLAVLSLPFVIIILHGVDFINLDLDAGGFGTNVATLVMYGGCWLLGFVYQDGRLETISVRITALIATSFMLLGVVTMYYADSKVLGESLEANALYTFGFTLLLLKLSVNFSLSKAREGVKYFVRCVNSRALSIYLWSYPATFAVETFLSNSSYFDSFILNNTMYYLVVIIASLALLFLIILAVGWVEDLAAGRRVQRGPWVERSTRSRTAFKI